MQLLLTEVRQTKSIVFVVALVVIGLVVCISLLRSEHRKENSAMNSLMVIVPYKYEGLWVFDDAAVGLSKEPFIAGIDSLIDKATANIPDAQHGFRAIFSPDNFPARASSWNGVERNRTATGITVRNSIRKAGCARRYSSISGVRRGKFT